jgi:hypothetical protein
MIMERDHGRGQDRAGAVRVVAYWFVVLWQAEGE